MLAHYDNRLDPLISIEQRMKARDAAKRTGRHPSPFGGNKGNNNSMMGNT